MTSTLLVAVLLLSLPLSGATSRSPQRRAGQRQQTPRDLDDKQGDYEKNSRRAAPRDAFPVFDNPTMKDANQTTIKDQEYVIGIECDGEAKAYPIAVMGRHELGNDVCGKTPITVSW